MQLTKTVNVIRPHVNLESWKVHICDLFRAQTLSFHHTPNLNSSEDPQNPPQDLPKVTLTFLLTRSMVCWNHPRISLRSNSLKVPSDKREALLSPRFMWTWAPWVISRQSHLQVFSCRPEVCAELQPLHCKLYSLRPPIRCADERRLHLNLWSMARWFPAWRLHKYYIRIITKSWATAGDRDKLSEV